MQRVAKNVGKRRDEFRRCLFGSIFQIIKLSRANVLCIFALARVGLDVSPKNVRFCQQAMERFMKYSCKFAESLHIVRFDCNVFSDNKIVRFFAIFLGIPCLPVCPKVNHSR